MEKKYTIGHNVLGMVQMGNIMSLIQLQALNRFMNSDTSGTFKDVHKLVLLANIGVMEKNIELLENDFPWLKEERLKIEAANASSND